MDSHFIQCRSKSLTVAYKTPPGLLPPDLISYPSPVLFQPLRSSTSGPFTCCSFCPKCFPADNYIPHSLTFFRYLFKYYIFSEVLENHRIATAHHPVLLISSPLLYCFLQHLFAISHSLCLLAYLLSVSISTLPHLVEYTLQEGSNLIF